MKKRKCVKSVKYAKKDQLIEARDEGYAVAAERLMVVEKENDLLRAKYNAMRDLVLDALKGGR